MRTIAIYGGTFDPIHNGHLQTSIAIQNHFHFDSFCFLPCKLPLLKNPALASNTDRIKMLELALQGIKEFQIDERELTRDTPSYMVKTLNSFRLENEDASLTLIMGYDSFLSIPQWHQWEKIITLANVLVIDRPEFIANQQPKAVQELVNSHQIAKPLDILMRKFGAIAFYNAGNYPISSSQIRQDIHQGRDVSHCLPVAVNRYIEKQELYQ